MADFRLGRLKFNWRGNWATTTEYVIDDIVKFGANSFVCIINHTSVGNETNWYATDFPTKWSLHTEGVVNKGEWVSATYYKINDIVKYGNTQYIVTQGFTAPGAFNTNNLTEYLSGFEYEDTWSGGTEYQPGDVVAFGGYTYIATSIHTNKIPSINLANDWDILTTGFTVVGTYSTTTNYNPGDVVQQGGYSYVAISTSTNAPPSVNTASWSLIVKGINWVGTWSSTTSYNLGDAVKRNSNSYVGIATTNANNDPATDSIGEYWNALAEGASDNVLTTLGDLVYQSGAGAARLPIGSNGQVLTAVSGDIPIWENNSITHTVYYVTEEGSDSNSGKTISRSFASLRHAVGIVTTGPATIYVKAGTYDEQLPIIIPAGVSIVGDNIRTTKIKPASGNADFQVLTLASIPPSLIYGNNIANGAGTKIAKILDSDYTDSIIHIQPLTGGVWTTADTWENGATDITINAVETRTNAEATMFFLSDKVILKDIVMEGMSGFISAGSLGSKTGSISGTIVTVPAGGLNPDLVGTTITGSGVSAGTRVVNYLSPTTIEVSVSQTVASTALTFIALASDINNATIKGVFCRLNPSSAITKSPYISNCSTFSTGGVGAIVDGRVHRHFGDASNKSMVFDSFTNIHDGGVAFWITNNAAAELVSSFTYFNHISYAVTRGGRLRSLSGNSSFGNFGVVSSGFNADEAFQSAKIEGLRLQYTTAGVSGSGFVEGERIVGSASTAVGLINSNQTGKRELLYSLITAGPSAGISTGFQAGETITGQTSGTTAILQPTTDANRGQAGFTLVLSNVGVTTFAPGGSIEFVTGSGNGGFNNDQITGADPFTYVIQNTSYIPPSGQGSIFVTRGELTSVAAAHTGGTTTIANYPTSGVSVSLSVPATDADTTIFVNTISGLTNGGYLLSPSSELLKIGGFPTATSVTVIRAQDGAGNAISYSSGDTFTGIGITSLIASREIIKDFAGAGTTSFRISNTIGFTTNHYIKIDNEFMLVTNTIADPFGKLILILSEEKSAQAFDEQNVRIRYLYSQARLTGHDFLSIGVGGTITTNWPGVPLQQAISAQEIIEGFPGRIFYVSTDQDGNFRVGKYFRINQATGAATLNASAFDLSGLAELRLGSVGAQLGAQINEFSTDASLSQNSNVKVPTQAAVKTYVDTSITTLTGIVSTNAKQVSPTLYFSGQS